MTSFKSFFLIVEKRKKKKRKKFKLYRKYPLFWHGYPLGGYVQQGEGEGGGEAGGD
jgi:hypothetical protein